VNREPQLPAPPGTPPREHAGHRLMMIACCIPMLAIAILLVATGAASPGFLLFAIGCTVMMTVMMRGMHGAKHGANDAHSHH